MASVFTPVAQLGEFGLIDRMQSVLETDAPPADLIAGIGDDAAVYRVSDDLAHVITTDALVEGVHFDRSFTPLGHLGRKAIAVNVSDVAAMNAVARFAVVSIGLPRNISVEMVESLYVGIQAACKQYGVRLVGGDTTAAPQLVLSVTVVGEARIADVVYRRGAQPGDALCVTGDVGSAYAGLQVLLEQQKAMQELGPTYEPNIEPYRYVIGRQLTPIPRTDVVAAFASARFRPTSLIDVSDGIASEVHHLCRHSACGALLHAAKLPLDGETRVVADERVTDADTYGLFGGEDYELLFTVDPARLDRLDDTLYTVIGTMTEATAGVNIRTADGAVVPLSPAGYAHFDEQAEGAPPEQAEGASGE